MTSRSSSFIWRRAARTTARRSLARAAPSGDRAVSSEGRSPTTLMSTALHELSVLRWPALHGVGLRSLYNPTRSGFPLDPDQLVERPVASIHGSTVHRGDAVDAETLDRVRGTHRPVQHRPAEDARVLEATALRDVAHESPGERVARAGRVDRLLERIRRGPERSVLCEEGRAVLATLHHQHLRPEGQHLARGLHDLERLEQLARLALVDAHDVDLADDVDEGLARVLDPVVHGVERHDPWPPHLRQRRQLDLGIDVREEDELAVGVGLGDLWTPVTEDAEIGVDRLGRVVHEVVDAAPAERSTAPVLDPGDIDTAGAQATEVGLAKVIANDADEADRRVQRRGHREVRRRPTQHAVLRREGCPHIVVRERADDEDATHGGAKDIGQGVAVKKPTSVKAAYVPAIASTIRSVSRSFSTAPSVAQ